jgi:hypothetical protein
MLKDRRGGFLMKKTFLIFIVLMLTSLSACGPNIWILEKDRLSELGNVEDYVGQLEGNQSEFRGYRVFTISEGKKMVVVSSGSSDKVLKFTAADVSKDTTTISVEEENKKSHEVNSYILIGIDEIQGEFAVVNESGEEFKAYE